MRRYCVLRPRMLRSISGYGARKVPAVVALHQVRAQVGEHLQELTEALPLQLAKRPIAQVLRHLFAPRIQAASHCGIAHCLPRLSAAFVQDVFDIDDPAVHVIDLDELARPGYRFSDNRLQASHLLRDQRAYCSPFFSNLCRLASTSSKALAASPAA